ncbi:MAG: transglycosylase domain-containing protein, partial [Bacteroidetes bacterium]|nr:transglycosylase domain-containing protein [Bacteroidota bacterium]
MSEEIISTQQPEQNKNGSDNREKKKSKYRLFIILFWILFSFPFVLGFLLFFGAEHEWLGEMPSFEELENPRVNQATEIYSEDKVLLGTYYLENRSNVKYAELSPYLTQALIATEDIRYHNHSGIDGIAVVRAVWGSVSGNYSGGGSTITQQLAKLLFHVRPQSTVETVKQKIMEWVISLKLERRYTKEEIIAMYLNKFDFINNAVGIKTASRVYFNTSPDSLKINQAAMLVGMVQNPSLFNPLRRPDTTLWRRNVVLGQMMKYNYITREAFDTLKTAPLGIDYQKVDHKEGSATYFREYLRAWLADWCNKRKKPDGSKYNFYRDGLRVYTTINSKMQQYAEEAVNEHLKALQKDFFTHWKGNHRHA